MRITGNTVLGGARRIATLVVWLALCAAATGCVRKTVSVPVAQKVRAARTATLEQLLERLERQATGIRSLSSASMRITFSAGRLDSGSLQEYRSAPGYILLRQPAAIRLNIQNPITKSTILELLSLGDDFSIWYPRDNKFFTGRNSAGEFEIEGQPRFGARPVHMFEAILPQWIGFDAPGTRVALEEDEDAEAKYYVLSYYRESGGMRLTPLRRLWVERSELALSRLETYTEGGAKSGIVRYSNLVDTEGFMLPRTVKMERPVDGYLMEMQFREWRVNPELPDSAFVLTAPSGAQLVALKERGRSQDH